jgi:hypothetical protein
MRDVADVNSSVSDYEALQVRCPLCSSEPNVRCIYVGNISSKTRAFNPDAARGRPLPRGVHNKRRANARRKRKIDASRRDLQLNVPTDHRQKFLWIYQARRALGTWDRAENNALSE